MNQHTHSLPEAVPSKTSAARQYTWLALAACTGLFASGRFAVPLAAWLEPVLLLHFVRRVGPGGVTLAWLTRAAVGMVAWHGLVPLPPGGYVVTITAIQSILFLPYLVDRWLGVALVTRRPVLATLVLPAAAVAAEYLLATASPWGTWCVSPYAQDDLRLLQLLSITGLWGITFVVTWLAPVIDALWREPRQTLRLAAAHASVVLGVYAFGAIRLHTAPTAPAVRVAWLARPDSEASRGYGRYVDAVARRGVFDFDLPAEDLDRLRPWMAAIRDDLLARTRREALGGAQLVFWSESAVPTLAPEVAGGVGRAEVLAGAARVAAETGAYLGASIATVHPRPVRTENFIALVAPAGGVALELHKVHPIYPVEAAVTVGNSTELPVATTPLGRISAAICHDFDFHRLFFDAGRGGADLVLDPSWDWDALFPLHSHMARFRAIEQGFALVRGVKEGHSLACDALGQIVASVDDRGPGPGLMVASVPVRHVATLYTSLGDGFAWLCLAGLGALALAAASRRRTSLALGLGPANQGSGRARVTTTELERP